MTDKKEYTLIRGQKSADTEEFKGVNISELLEQISADTTRQVKEAIKTIIQPTGDISSLIDQKVAQDLRDLINGYIQELKELQPYIEDELKKPQYGGKSLEDLEAEAERDEHGILSEDSLYSIALESARIAKQETEKENNRIAAAERQREKQPEYSKIRYKESYQTKVITDKFMRYFFFLWKDQSEEEQGKSLPATVEELRENGTILKYEGANQKKEINLYFDCFVEMTKLENMGIDPVFTGYDFFLCNAIDNLLEQGNTSPTLTKIWHELGNTGSPGGKQLTKLFKGLLKGESTTIISDTHEVMDQMGNRSGSFSMRRVLSIDFKNINYTIDKDGEIKVSDGQIEIKGHSIFYEVGDSTKRITAYSNEFFRRYKGHRTDLYWSILYYLIWQIAWLRNPKGKKRSNKITYQSVFDHVGAVYQEKPEENLTPKERRARKKKITKTQERVITIIYDIIDQMFIPEGHITGRQEATSGEPGVILQYTKAGKITHKKQ